ncbi:MAG TPA: hemerythrin domain-containing protein [Actinomycetes bacterium]|nr:hemerythrin domain-containing protein [Actinomycetes bacterium]
MNRGSSVTASVQEDHQRIRGQLRAALAAVPDHAEPHRPQVMCETFLATLSRHISAVEDVLYPAVRESRPDGRSASNDQVHAAREIERSMRQLEGSFAGDRYAVATPRAELWTDLVTLFESHVQDEERLTTRLDADLGEAERAELARQLTARHNVAPTRPHPHSPHSRRAGRLTHRLWSLADRAMDAMDNRQIVPKAAARRPVRNSRWTQYLLGRAQFEEPEPRLDPPAGGDDR